MIPDDPGHPASGGVDSAWEPGELPGGRPPQSEAEAAAILDGAIRFSSAPPDNVRVLVLVGAAGPEVLAGAFDRLPSLSQVLVIEPDPAAARSLVVQAMESRLGPALLERCKVAELPDTPSPALALKVYLELWQFLIANGVAPGDALVVEAGVDTPARPAPGLALARLAVRDLCSGFSARFLALLAAGDLLPPAALRTIADFLFEAGQRYHALKFYWFLHHERRATDVAWKILECWADLQAFDQVERWCKQPVFPDSFRRKLARDLQLEQRKQRGLRRGIWGRNLTALRAGFPEVAARLEKIGSDRPTVVQLPDLPWRLEYRADSVTLQRAPYLLLLRIEGPLLREVNPLPDPDEVHRAVMSPTQASLAHVCVGAWTAAAAAAEILLSTEVTVAQPNWCRLAYLVEPDPAALAVLLETVDFSSWLVPDRTHLFLGLRAGEELVAFLRERPDHAIPAVRAGVDPSLSSQLEAVEVGRMRNLALAVEQLESRYDGRHAEQTVAVLEGRVRRPLRIAWLTSLYTSVVRHVVGDLAAGLRELGHECLVLEEEAPGRILHHQTLANRLLEREVDFVGLVNYLRPDLGFALPDHLPVVTWIQDELPHLRDPARIRKIGSHDLAFGFSTPVQELYRTLGYPRVAHLPFAVRSEWVGGEIPERCRDEVVYATNVVEPAEPDFARGLRGWFTERLDREAEIPLSRVQLEPILAEARPRLGPLTVERWDELLFWALMVARSQDRIRVADAVLRAGLPLALYGLGWHELVRFRGHARGVVSAGEPLREVLRSHKVVLHINRGCNMHPRVLEGFSAGGFVIARRDAADDFPGETADQFAIGRELHLFDGEADMVALIRRALQDEPWRRATIAAAQARIRAQHTYRNRAESLLEHLRRALSTPEKRGASLA